MKDSGKTGQIQLDTDVLQEALQAAGVGVWVWDAATDLMRWTPEAGRLHGLPDGVYEGRFDDMRDRVHPEDLPRLRARVEAVLANPGQGYHTEHRVLPRPGEVRWVQGRGRVLVDAEGRATGIVGVVFDITASRLAREQLLESEERYRLFTELASDYVYAVDLDPNAEGPSATAVVAGSFERVTGYSAGDMERIGGWLEVIHPEDRAIMMQAIADIRAGKRTAIEYRIFAKSGEVRWLRDRSQPMGNPGGGPLRVMGGVQDITERKRLEQQLADAQRLESMAELAGCVAHDLNNLITVMMGANSLLQSLALPPNASSSLELLQRAIENAAGLTRSLLTFGRRQPATAQVVELDATLSEIACMLERSLGPMIAVKLRCDTAGARVAVGVGQLETALLNLALNASDAMPKGGEFHIGTRLTTFTQADPKRPPELAPGEYVSIDASDSGCGIRPELLAQVFEPFFTTKPAGRGTGLGLASVHGIVRQLGGAITVRSTLGSGTTFSIHLPISRAELTPETVPTREAAVSASKTMIAIVEDDHRMRRLLLRVLDELGYRSAAFASAEEALASGALKECTLLVSDIGLPGMAGTDLAIEITAERPDLPVLLISGYVSNERQRAVVESGRFSFLQKPFEIASFSERLREMLEDHAKG